MVDLSIVALKYTWIFGTDIHQVASLVPRPNNPSVDRFRYLAQDTGRNPCWSCLGLGMRLPSGYSNAAPPCLITNTFLLTVFFNEWNKKVHMQ